MKNIEIRKVETNKALRQFVQFYYDLYRDCPYAVPFLYSDELSTLRSDQNPAFDHCEAEYFLAVRDGKIVGRVAAIINYTANKRWNRQQVRVGWFDFIDDLEVSSALLQTVEKWGAERGMTEICGPLGFTDMDREGMLVEGFDRLSTMYINYNYPYYPVHLEKLGGFHKDNDYMEYRVNLSASLPVKYQHIAEIAQKRYNLKIHKFSRDELLRQGKGHELFEILNQTYDGLYGFSRLDERQVDKLVEDYIQKADLKLVTAILDGNDNDRMIGFGISFPSFSKALRKTRDGRLLPFGWWHLIKTLKFHKTDTVDLLLIGVLPQYRTKGATAMIFTDLMGVFKEYGFKWAEAMPQMEDNTAVRAQWHYLDSEQHRRHRCFCKQL